MKNKINWLIIHHTGGTKNDPLADTSNQTFEIVNKWHKENPNVWLGQLSSFGYAIGYTYFIDKTGKVTQGRSDTEQSAHCKGYNNNPWDSPENSSIGICLAGNFDVTFPTSEQIESLKKLLIEKMKQYSIPSENVLPHRHFANKTCYGMNLDSLWASKLTIPIVLPPKPVENMCVAQEEEIAHLKEQLSWYDKLLSWFFSKVA